jgi:hypothetical protein
MQLWAKSQVGSNINGQPPSITVIPCVRLYSVAAEETLPAPHTVRSGSVGIAADAAGHTSPRQSPVPCRE